MRRRFVLLALALLSGPAAGLEFLTEENPPLNFTRDGQAVGIGTAMVRELARRAGVEAPIRVMPWSVAFETARSGDNACVYSTVRNKQRMDQFQWVGPITRGEYSAFGLERFSERPKRVDDLKQYRIGVMNDARATYLRERGFDKVFTFEKNEEIPKYLTVGGQNPNGVDLWVTQAFGAQRIARLAGVPDIKVVFSGILTQDYWLACGKKVPADLVAKLNTALQGMHKDGTTRKIHTSEEAAEDRR